MLKLEDVKDLSEEELLEKIEAISDNDMVAMDPDILKEIQKRMEVGEATEKARIEHLKSEREKDLEFKKLEADLGRLKGKTGQLKTIGKIRLGGSKEETDAAVGDKIRKALVKIEPDRLLYLVKGKGGRGIKIGGKVIIEEGVLFDPEFMRFLTNRQYLALMKSEALSETDKEKITKARYKFAQVFIESGEMNRYWQQKKAYEAAFANWLEAVKTKPGLPMPVEPDLPMPEEIKERFRNELKDGIAELAELNHYWPDLFDHFEVSGHIRFGMIQKMREHEDFSGRGRYIREAKVQDFIDVVKHLENAEVGKEQSLAYLLKFTPEQLRGLRERMAGPIDGKAPVELPSIGSRSWSSPITMDFYGRTLLPSFIRSDNKDRRIITKHILMAWAIETIVRKITGKKVEIMSSENRDGLQWLRQKKEGHGFYNTDNVIGDVIGEIVKDERAREMLQRSGLTPEDLRKRLEQEYPKKEAGGDSTSRS